MDHFRLWIIVACVLLAVVGVVVDHLFYRKPPLTVAHAQRERLWYLCFSDERAFRGAAISEGATMEDAITATREHSCDPGGDVLAVKVPNDAFLDPRTPIFKLLSYRKLKRYGFKPTAALECRLSE